MLAIELKEQESKMLYRFGIHHYIEMIKSYLKAINEPEYYSHGEYKQTEEVSNKHGLYYYKSQPHFYSQNSYFL